MNFTTTTTFAFFRRFFCICLLGGNFLIAQPARYFFEHLTTKDGLSQNDVNCILQDETGFLWFGTNDGLNRYDGYAFEVFRPRKNDSSAIISNLIQALQDDHLGRIWVGTAGEGISCFLPRYQRFVNLKTVDPDHFNLQGDFILDIWEDSEHRLWIGSATGLSLLQLTDTYEPATASIQNLTRKLLPTVLLNGRIEAIFEDNQHQIWIGSSVGLFKLREKETKGLPFEVEAINTNLHIRSIKQDERGNIIVGTQTGLYVLGQEIDGAYNMVRVSTNSCDRVLVQPDGIWTTSAQGLGRFEYGPDDALPVLSHMYTSDLADFHSLSKTVLRTIYASESGTIWIGTNGGGVNKFEPEQKIFFHYKNTLEKGTISYDKIRSVFEDSYENLWIGTEGGGLNFLPYDAEAPGNYNNFHHLPSPPNIFSLAEYQHKDKRYLLIGGQNTPGLYQTEIKPGMESLSQVSSRPVSAVTGSVFALANTDNTYIWAGTYNNGLYRLRIGEEEQARQFLARPDDPYALSSPLIRSLMYDREGNLWIGTGRGLNRIKAGDLGKFNPEFEHYLNDPDDPESILHNYILALFQSQNGDVWVGTFGGGLNKFIPAKGEKAAHFVSYTEADGLPNNVVKGILEDDKGFLWLSTNRGLTRFDPLSGKFDNFDTRDGLQSDEFSELAGFRRRNGDMIFGGVNGFNVFKPDSTHLNPHPPKVALTEFQLWNKVVGLGESFNGRVIMDSVLFLTKEIHLKHHENSFSLGFSGFHYRAPIKNTYAFKLEGLHKDWIYVNSDKRFANFTNLDPGTYTFKVKAANSDGIWNESPTQITIHIARPFWLSWWAFILYGLVLAGCIWILAHYTFIGIREKHQLVLEHLEKEKNEEVQHMKLQFFTNISHELRTPLSLISGPIEHLIRGGKELAYGQREKQYQLIRKNADYLLRLVNQLLDFRRVDQGIVKLQVSYNDIESFIREVSEPFEFVARQNKISFEISAHPAGIMAWFDPGIVEKTVYNLLSNAFKYTRNHGRISLEIRCVEEHSGRGIKGVKGDRIEIRVSDSGVGVARKNREKIFERFFKGSENTKHNPTGVGIGLAYTREIVKVHHGAIWVEDHAPQGACFVVVLPQGEKAYSRDEKARQNDLDMNRYINGASIPALSALLQESDTPIENDSHILPAALDSKQVMLLIDDNPDIRTFLREAFQAEYRILEAEDGEAGWELALAQNPDLIISDVMMPRMDGIALCHLVKEDQRTSHIPLILLTAKTSEESELEGLKNRADAFVRKPFKLDVLRYTIQNILLARTEMQKRFRREVILEPTEIAVTSTDETFLKKAMDIIEERMTDPDFNVEVLAQEIAMSRSKLYLKLKALTGQSSSEFIRTIRLKRAVQLLESSDLAVKEVMFMTGFNTASYFSKCFKKQFGVVPKDYMRTKKALADAE